MHRLSSTSRLAVLLLAGAYALVPETAHAYLDPGSGSYIFQMILAVLVSAVFALKVYWKKLTSFLSQLVSGGESKNEGPQQ